MLLVRHGQSLNNALAEQSSTSYEQERIADAPLTALGRVQAATLAPVLAAAAARRAVTVGAPTQNSTTPRETPAPAPPLLSVYCSAMDRALETASLAVSQTTLRPRVWPSICEIGGLFDLLYAGEYSPGVRRAVIGNVGVKGLGATAISRAYPMSVVPTDGSVGEDGWYRNHRKETQAEGEVRVRGVIAELRRAAVALSVGADAAAPGFDVRVALRHSVSADDAVAAVLSGVTLGKVSGSRGAALAGSAAIALVCHGDFIETFLRLACAPAPESNNVITTSSHLADDDELAAAAVPAEFCVHNCSISTVDFFPSGAVRVVRVNDVSHLLYPHAGASAGSAGAGATLASPPAARVDLITGGCIV